MANIKDNPNNGLKVLYVEPDKIRQNKVFELLQSRDYAVSLASSGEEALRFLEKQNVDAVFCQQILPDMTGLKFLEDLKKRRITVPFVLVVDATSPELAQQAARLGAYHFLKNIDSAEIMETLICQAIEHAKLQKQEAGLLHLILDASPIPTVISRIDTGEILYANKEIGNVLGYNQESVIGRPAGDFYADPSQREQMIQMLKESGRVTNFEAKLKKGDGKIASVVYSGGIMELRGEKVLLSGVYDITDRKEAEQALKLSEERFRGYIEQAKDIVFTMDARGVFTYLSPRFQELLGWEPGEFVGKLFSDLMHQDDVNMAQKWFESGFQDTGWRTRDGFRLRQKNGEWRWFTSDATIIENDEKVPVEVLGIAHDITEIRELIHSLENANKEIRHTQAQLAQSEKMASLGILVAGIAHEINTPVGAISSMQDSLTRGIKKLKDEVARACFNEDDKRKFESIFSVVDEANKVISSGAQRVGTIVRRLRSFARLDEAELKSVNIHEGIEDTLTLVHHELKHDIEVIREFGEIMPIPCFPGQLNQVFLNLIVNARQAIKGKGKIKIRTKTEGQIVLIEISDTGVGIPKENLSRIFDPGFTTKGVGVGTGLGLSICYQIIKEHRGEIAVKSEQGKGSTFTIKLPTNLDKLIETK